MKKHFSRFIAVVLAVLCIVPLFVFQASALTPVTYRTGANSISSSYAGSHYYSNFQKIQLTGDGRTDALAVALSQLGYMESDTSGDYAGTTAGSGNYTEYCYNMGSVGGYAYQWCATYCSWALYQSRCCDILGSSTGDWCRNHLYTSSAYIWREVGCQYWANQLQYYGYYQKSAYNGGNYTPQAGDLIFFYSSGGINHIGFVLYTSGGYVYTVEGNTGGSAGVVANGGRVCAKSYGLSDSYIAGYGVLPYKVVDNEYTNIDYSGGTRTPGYYNNPDAAKYIYSDEACTQSLGVVARYTMFEVTQVCASGKVKCVATIDDGTTVTGYMDPSASRIIQITSSGETYSQEYIDLRALINSTLDLRIVDYTANEAIAIRAAYANAVSVLNSDASTDADYKNAYDALYSAIHTSAHVLSVGKSYTRTAPARGDMYDDDLIRLTDGIKSSDDGGSSAYAGWSNSADITVDLGSAQNANTFTAYLAGGPWGIDVPDENYYLTVSYSNDGSNFTELGTTNYSQLKRGNGTELDWSYYEITIISSTVNARYYKFSLNRTDGGFVWLDEVEIADYSEPLLLDKLYVNGMNTLVEAGDCIIFTPAFGTITAANANHVWTYNVIAKWDESQNAYVVTKSYQGDGTGVDTTLASDEIFIAAHCWEGEGVDVAVPGSALNHQKLADCKVGDLIQLSNITVSLGYYDVLAYASITHKTQSGDTSCSHNYVSSVTKPTCTKQGYTTHTCSLCGGSYDDTFVNPRHTEGAWKTLADGSQELRCSVCGTLLDSISAPIDGYQAGDVNGDGVIDMFDYLMVKSMYFEAYYGTDGERQRADVNADGSIDMFDYLLVKTAYFES